MYSMNSLWPWFLTAWPCLLGGATLLALLGLWRGYRYREPILDWVEARAHAHAEKHMTWRTKARFDRRIGRRIRWLKFRQWVRSPRTGSWMQHLRRPLAIVMIFGASIGLMTVAGVPLDQVVNRLKALANGEGENLQWQTALILMGTPIAFTLWWFRDIHVNETLANQRKDVNLKEFQEIQMRAAGALDDKFPAASRETLQIAAIHQLRPFLKGEYGDSFRRPAWEFLRARLRASAASTGERAIAEWSAAGGFSVTNGDSARDRADRTKNEIWSKIAQCAPGPVTQAARAVVREEVPVVFQRGLPLTDTQFDGIDFPRGALLARLQLRQSSFVGASLCGAHLEGADLRGAHLEGVDLSSAHLEGADMGDAHLEGAHLGRAHLEGANLFNAHLEGADLGYANLEGADVSEAHLQGASLREAHLEGANLFGAHLEGADMGRAHLEGAHLGMANLERANLFGAHLKGANLVRANLVGADLRMARIAGTEFVETQLGNAKFGGTAFDDDTIVIVEQKLDTGELDQSVYEMKLASARYQLRKRGARHVSENPDGREFVEVRPL
jgi:uncharacterized protein YjbI with pentapeptide repeats